MIKKKLLHTIYLKELSWIKTNLLIKLEKFGIYNLQDLLMHLPVRYEDRTKIYNIKNVLPGMFATVHGEILNTDIIYGKKIIISCRLRDNSGIINIIFFNFTNLLKNILLPGKFVIAYGKIICNKYGDLEIINPEFNINKNNKNKIINSLTPIYSKINGISQTTLRSLIYKTFKLLDFNLISELIPNKLNYTMISIVDALRILHKPPKAISIKDIKYCIHPAQRRIIFEELLAYSLSLLNFRYKIKKNINHYHCDIIKI